MGKTILIVEDDKLIREGITMVLEQAGHTVHAVENGKLGLAEAKKLHPDLVLTDIMMPVMDGHEMLENLRKDDWGRTVPVIIMTADESANSINAALQSGVTTYLSKASLDPEALSDQILAAIG